MQNKDIHDNSIHDEGLRKKLYDIIEPQATGGSASHTKTGRSKASSIYDIGMIIVILLSLLPMVFKNEYAIFRVTEILCVAIFILDYLLRWVTADYRYEKRSLSSFLRYPFSPMAIMDLLSMLPSLIAINSAFRTLRLLRLLRALRVFRVVKMLRYSKNFEMLRNVYLSSKKSLFVVFVLAIGYILTSALVIFQIEPETFEDFFEAVYWATISLTTVGYGDIYATSMIGRFITMASAVMGIAVVALPAGIITAGYMDELRKARDDEDGEDKS